MRSTVQCTAQADMVGPALSFVHSPYSTIVCIWHTNKLISMYKMKMNAIMVVFFFFIFHPTKWINNLLSLLHISFENDKSIFLFQMRKNRTVAAVLHIRHRLTCITWSRARLLNAFRCGVACCDLSGLTMGNSFSTDFNCSHVPTIINDVLTNDESKIEKRGSEEKKSFNPYHLKWASDAICSDRCRHTVSFYSNVGCAIRKWSISDIGRMPTHGRSAPTEPTMGAQVVTAYNSYRFVKMWAAFETSVSSA